MSQLQYKPYLGLIKLWKILYNFYMKYSYLED